MRVILNEDVEKLGKAGDLVTVKAGYGRNYLIPKGKAVIATPRSIKRLEHQKKMVQDGLRRAKKGHLEFAKRIEATEISIAVKVGEEDRLFGSVTAKDIHQRLAAGGIEIDRKQIVLEDPIKALGDYSIPVRLHPEVVPSLKVQVVREEA